MPTESARRPPCASSSGLDAPRPGAGTAVCWPHRRGFQARHWNLGQRGSAMLSACGGVLHDCVITGHDRGYVSAMAWLNPVAAAQLTGGSHPAEGYSPALIGDPRVRAYLARCVPAAYQPSPPGWGIPRHERRRCGHWPTQTPQLPPGSGLRRSPPHTRPLGADGDASSGPKICSRRSSASRQKLYSPVLLNHPLPHTLGRS